MQKKILILSFALYSVSVYTQTNRYDTYVPTTPMPTVSSLVSPMLNAQRNMEAERLRLMYKGRFHIFGGLKGHDTYLGCLNCPNSDLLSIWNANGKFGINNATDDENIWNEKSNFGNPKNNISPWNQSGNNPPAIVDFDGNFFGYFTANKSKDKRTDLQMFLLFADNYEFTRDNYVKVGDSMK